MALMSYVQRDKAGTYYLRRVIPPALRPFMPPPWTGKSEWKRSLRTKDPAVAKRAGSHFLRDCMADFLAAERAQRGEAPSPQLTLRITPQEVEADVLAELLHTDEVLRRDGGDARRQLHSPEDREKWPDLEPVRFGARGMEEDQAEGYRQELELLHGDFRAALARSDTRTVDVFVRRYLGRKGVGLDPASDAFYEVALAVLRAHVEAYGRMRERHEGQIVPTPAPSAGRGPTLSEAFELWKAGTGTRGGRKPSANTVLEAEYAVRRFRELHGDCRLGDVTREQARVFRDELARVPTRLPVALKRLPLPDLLKRNLSAYPVVHTATVNKYLTLLAAIFVHAENGGRLEAVTGFRNPFGPGLKLDADARASGGRQMFDPADLAAIFGTGVYRRGERPAGGAGEAAYWLPLLGLLSGARQGELAQLRVADLAQDPESGVWFLNIGTEGGRSIKTAASRRKVPIHPALERIGLLRYRQAMVDAGSAPGATLWPDLASDNAGRLGGPWSKWFNRYLRDKAGVEDRTKVFHSFRHTFKRMARDASVPKEVHDVLTGHTGGEDVGQAYGRGFALPVLAAAMAKIPAPAVLDGIRWEAGPRTHKRPPSGRR